MLVKVRFSHPKVARGCSNDGANGGDHQEYQWVKSFSSFFISTRVVQKEGNESMINYANQETGVEYGWEVGGKLP